MAFKAGEAGRGQARPGGARQYQGRRGGARHGVVRPGAAGAVWHGMARPGRAISRQARRGEARRGLARQYQGNIKAGEAGRGQARQGEAGHGKAGMAGHGPARQGEAGHGKAGIQLEAGMMNESIIHGVQRVAQALYDQHGRVETRALVEAARAKDSPAHPAFEWDNKKAGEEYRLIQARSYLRKITIVREEEPERLIHVPRAVTNAEADTRDGHYQVASVLIQHPDEFERALNAAAMRMDASKRALDDLHDVAEKTERSEQARFIVQMSKATQIFTDALRAMH